MKTTARLLVCALPAIAAAACSSGTPEEPQVREAARPAPPPAAEKPPAEPASRTRPAEPEPRPAAPPAAEARAESQGKPAPGAASPGGDEPLVYVLMETSMGDIVLELDRVRAPISVANFLSYADRGFYDGTIFHRVVEQFVIQGGGFTASLVKKETDPPIRNEWGNGLSNRRGTIAMARTSLPDSATSQFYINVQDNTMLDRPRQANLAGYAVFGRVVAGMDVVDAIRVVEITQRAGMEGVPVTDVVIEKVARLGADEARRRGAATGGSGVG